MGRLLLLAATVAAFLACSAPADASPYVRYGLQDDAWLVYGPGTLDERIARARPNRRRRSSASRSTGTRSRRSAGSEAGGAPIRFSRACATHGIAPVVTLYGAPRWANRRPCSELGADVGLDLRGVRRCGRKALSLGEAVARLERAEPASLAASDHPADLCDEAAQSRLRCDPPARSPDAKVGGGVTAPRASTGGVSPVAWIRGMGAAEARLDAYAHNPYPLKPFETPSTGGCDHCETITMATLERLQREVWRRLRLAHADLADASTATRRARPIALSASPRRSRRAT